MRKTNSMATTGALLKFTKLKEVEQNSFISQMNEFLLASCRRRKLLVEQWESELTSPSRSQGDSNHASPRR